MALGGVRSVLLHQGCGSSQFVDDRSSMPLRTDISSVFTHHCRGLGALLLPSLDIGKPTSSASSHSELSSPSTCNEHSAASHSQRMPRIRTSTDDSLACTGREPAMADCSSPSSAASASVTDSPLKTFQASHHPCSPSSESSFLSSYQDLNCTRVAAFADAAAAPSLLQGCKDGAFSPSPSSSCLTSRESSSRGFLQWDESCAPPVDAPVTSEAAEKRPQAGWQLVTFAIVLSSDPSAASGTIKKLLDDGALWSLDTTRRTTVLFMVAVLAIIDVLSLLDNFRLIYILQQMPFKIPAALQPAVELGAALWGLGMRALAAVAFTVLQLLIALVCMR